MGVGKLNKFLEIKSIQNIKDDEGFSTKQEVIIAKVRGYREGRHGSEKWANRTTFTEATDLFIIRNIPGVKLNADMVIFCDGENFEITSIEDVKGKNMYIEILAKKVIQSG
jgi:head-tail adaptor